MFDFVDFVLLLPRGVTHKLHKLRGAAALMIKANGIHLPLINNIKLIPSIQLSFFLVLLIQLSENVIKATFRK